MHSMTLEGLEIKPATPERWQDIETLFEGHGSCSDCWCQYWRLPRIQFAEGKGEGNKEALRNMIETGQTPGLLAYVDGQIAAWCSVGPRESYASLESSRSLVRVDDAPVWSIVCFFVAKPFRRRGLSRELLLSAIAYAKEHGAQIVEAYPTDRQDKVSGSAGYMGIASTFRELGFVEVLRPSKQHTIMRYRIEK